MNFNPPLNVEPEDSQETAKQSGPPRVGQRRWLGRISLFGVALALGTALASGAWSHYEQHRQVVATLEQGRDLVPQVRVAAVGARPRTQKQTQTAPPKPG